MRGRPDDSPDVQLSKTLSYILRHGAAKEGLTMRKDGFIRLDDIVSPAVFPVAYPRLTVYDAAEASKAQGGRRGYRRTHRRRECEATVCTRV